MMWSIPEAHLHQWLLLFLLRTGSGLSLTPWELLPLPWPLTLTQEGPEQEQWTTYCLREDRAGIKGGTLGPVQPGPQPP